METENGGHYALTKEISSQPSLRADVDELNYAIEIAELEQILGRVSIFGTLSAAELTSLARALSPVSALDGEHIYRQGELAETFFVILSGAVQKIVEGGDPGKPSIPISEPLTAGAYFGQTALVVSGGKRSCSMRALGDTELRVISRAQFHKSVGDLKELLKRNPAVYQKYRSYFNNSTKA